MDKPKKDKEHYIFFILSLIIFFCFSMFLRSEASLAQSCLSFRLEGVLGTSWEHLGRVLGPSWTVMVASWGVLMRFVGVLGPSWLPKKLPRSLQEASKTPPKTRSNIESSWERSESKKPIKTNEKAIKKNLSWQVNGKRV